MFVNARALIERETANGTEIVVQIRNKPAEGGKWFELPGGRVEEFESLLDVLAREVREETGLQVVEIEGTDTRIQVQSANARVECLMPFAVYQTLQGPVDSMGVYFRCHAAGELAQVGDDTEEIQWVPVQRVAEWLAEDAERFSWVDRAGIVLYLQILGEESNAARAIESGHEQPGDKHTNSKRQHKAIERNRACKALRVEIRVRGRIDEQWSEWFSDLEISHAGQNETVLAGAVLDQAAIYGLLASLNGLNLPLVSVRVSEGGEEEDAPIEAARQTE